MSKPTPEEFDAWTEKFFNSKDNKAFMDEIDSHGDEEWQEEMSSFLLGIFISDKPQNSKKKKQEHDLIPQ